MNPAVGKIHIAPKHVGRLSFPRSAECNEFQVIRRSLAFPEAHFSDRIDQSGELFLVGQSPTLSRLSYGGLPSGLSWPQLPLKDFWLGLRREAPNRLPHPTHIALRREHT